MGREKTFTEEETFMFPTDYPKSMTLCCNCWDSRLRKTHGII